MPSLKRKETGDDGRSNDGGENSEKRASNRWSPVWDHFTLDKGTMKAVCNRCKGRLRGDSKAGTSHLTRHLETCKLRPCKDANTEIQSLEKRITAACTSAFRREKLPFVGERSKASVAPHSGNKKRAVVTRERRDDDQGLKKRVRQNKEKHLKRPSKESGLITEGDILIGENNNLSVQLAFQNWNNSNLEMGAALEHFVAEHQQLIKQNQQQEAQIKELTEALDSAKAEIREEKEARVAAEQKLSALTKESHALRIDKDQTALTDQRSQRLGANSSDEAPFWDFPGYEEAQERLESSICRAQFQNFLNCEEIQEQSEELGRIICETLLNCEYVAPSHDFLDVNPNYEAPHQAFF